MSACWCADPGRTDADMYQCPAGDAGEECLAHDYLAVGGALGYGIDPRTPIPELTHFRDAVVAAEAGACPMTATTGMVLRRAAEIISANGWHTGGYYDAAQAESCGIAPERCRVDTLGAIGLAAGADLDDTGWLQAGQLASVALAGQTVIALAGHEPVASVPWRRDAPSSIGHAISMISIWNDESGRTAEQVIDALNIVADALDGSTT